MQHNQLLKNILDIEAIMLEIEKVNQRIGDNFNLFNNDFLAKRAIERQLEIIGEAINQMVKIDPNSQISGAKPILGLRNLIIHAYDAVDAELLWGIIKRDNPVLKEAPCEN